MLTNADVTLYLYCRKGDIDTYQRMVVEDVFWDDVKQANVSKTGQRDSDSVLLVIPMESIGEEIHFTAGKDLVVKGVCYQEIDSSNQQALSESQQKLKQQKRFCTVMVVDEKLFGGEPHYELSCK